MSPKSAIFLLAHGDDEVMGLHLLGEFEIVNYLVIYLTNSHPEMAKFSQDKRSGEIKLSSNLLNFEYVEFGITHDVIDGRLCQDFNPDMFNSLMSFVKSYNPDILVTTSYQGGHQDHDGAFIISSKIASKLNLDLVSFPTYRLSKSMSYLFSVMSYDGREEFVSIKPRILERFYNAKMAWKIIKIYKTQAKTFLFLGVQILLRYSCRNNQFKVNEKLELCDISPLYEIRGKANLNDVLKFADII